MSNIRTEAILITSVCVPLDKIVKTNCHCSCIFHFHSQNNLSFSGYNNDAYFYQRPHQPMWTASSDAYNNGNDELGRVTNWIQQKINKNNWWMIMSGGERSIKQIIGPITSKIKLSRCENHLCIKHVSFPSEELEVSVR